MLSFVVMNSTSIVVRLLLWENSFILCISIFFFQIESSFRVMDEYDVFMDEVARKETIVMMSAYVKQPEQRGQCILLYFCEYCCNCFLVLFLRSTVHSTNPE